MSEENQRLSLVPTNQNFVCLSFFDEKDENQNTLTYLRIGGVFSTYDEACAHAKQINDHDPNYNVFVGDMGKWLPVARSDIKDVAKEVEYGNEQLDKLMKNYKINQEKAKLFHEHRKNEKMMTNINDNLEQQNKNREELTKKLSKAKTFDEVKTLTTSMDNLEEQIKRMEERLKQLTTEQNKLIEKIGDEKIPE